MRLLRRRHRTWSEERIDFEAGKQEGIRIERQRMRRGLQNAGTHYHPSHVGEGFTVYSAKQVDVLVEDD